MKKDPGSRDTMDAQIRMPQQRSAMGHSDVELGGEKGKTGYSLWHKDRLVRKMCRSGTGR